MRLIGKTRTEIRDKTLPAWKGCARRPILLSVLDKLSGIASQGGQETRSRLQYQRITRQSPRIFITTFHTVLTRSSAGPSTAPALSVGAPSFPLLILPRRGYSPLADKLIPRPCNAADGTLLRFPHPEEIAHATIMKAAAAVTVTAALSLSHISRQLIPLQPSHLPQ